jgi:hypothetical protein
MDDENWGNAVVPLPVIIIHCRSKAIDGFAFKAWEG